MNAVLAAAGDTLVDFIIAASNALPQHPRDDLPAFEVRGRDIVLKLVSDGCAGRSKLTFLAGSTRGARGRYSARPCHE